MTTLTKRVDSLRPILGLVSVAAFLLAWHLAARLGGLPAFILPAPADVWTRFLRALVDGSLLSHTFVTLAEVLVGLLAGALFATLIGYLVAKSACWRTCSRRTWSPARPCRWWRLRRCWSSGSGRACSRRC